jgi:hypothetical protein
MYSVKWKEKHAIRKRFQWHYATHLTAPNKGRKCKFEKRQQARQWIRNHVGEWCGCEAIFIVHPDGKKEEVNP